MIEKIFTYQLYQKLCRFAPDSSVLTIQFTQTDFYSLNIVNKKLNTSIENQWSFLADFLNCWLEFQDPALRDVRGNELLAILGENHQPLLGFNLLFVLTNKDRDLSAWCGLPDEINAQEARNQHYLNIKLFTLFGPPEIIKNIVAQICVIYRKKGKELTKFQQHESSAIWLPIKFS